MEKNRSKIFLGYLKIAITIALATVVGILVIIAVLARGTTSEIIYFIAVFLVLGIIYLCCLRKR